MKFPQLVPKESVWIPVRRFCILTLELKGHVVVAISNHEVGYDSLLSVSSNRTALSALQNFVYIRPLNDFQFGENMCRGLFQQLLCNLVI